MADLNVNSALCVCSSSGQSGLQQRASLLQREKENKLHTFNWFYWQSSSRHHIYSSFLKLCHVYQVTHFVEALSFSYASSKALDGNVGPPVSPTKISQQLSCAFYLALISKCKHAIAY